MLLEGKVAIVTGASKGLGRAIALKLAKEGAKVAVMTRRDMEGLKKTAELVEGAGSEALVIQGDVSNPNDTKKMADATFEKFGKIDILVNNAAFYYGVKRRPFFEIPPEEFDTMLSVNVKGTWLCVCAVFPYMSKRKKGKIINLASEVFFTGSHGFVHYVASKGGVVGLTRALAVELGPYGICINAVAPGFTATEASATIADLSKYDVSRTPLRRLGQPEDVAGIVAFLASDDADFITGQTVLVDGGRAMH